MTPLEITLLALVGLLALGVPIFMSLAIAAAAALMTNDLLPISILHNTLFDGLNIFPLLAIPCFVVAGTLMEYGNITHQIVDVVKQMVGRMYGGLGITTIVACTFFAAISGSGPGTVAAVGTILIPAMLRNGYSKEYAAAAASSGGTIGILIPPSNPMIIYAIIGNLSVTAMFTAGFIPGFIVSAAMIATAFLLAKRSGFKGDESAPPFAWRHFCASCRKCAFALATPVVILGSIYTGYATPVEASVVAIIWALFVGIVINRALKWEHVVKALLEGAMVCGAVLLIVGTSTLFGKILTYEEAPQRLANLVLGFSDSPEVVLLLIIALLYVLGMFMETLSTIIILVPVLLPMIIKLGIDPIHFGIILVVTNNVAMLTPPLGVNLFVASRITNLSVERTSVAVLPYLAALTICILLFTFCPAISTWLPYTLGYGQ
ncbi:TRAP transporter large permease [Nitratidesulfovibrio sp. HK-II]|jgi:C4-dicarboxylate transporter DctM subunit|uniref:TRAP transporter large permease n=1 Tax=Nitratidesulfovibrio sp. HK-II TaxID=2009266 RepID=UPI000E2F713B|nr:TRAP transporter large permease [Nitratidesulfovibrio sp. HK-II]GBO97575.1 TRAP-type C4-dicarboxylate transport system [Nitratidesulfovibrio sp. HK-II]